MSTAQIGTILGLIFSFSGLILSVVFVSAVLNKGKRFLNNTDILCASLVVFEGLYCLVGLAANIRVLSNDYVTSMGFMCYFQGTLSELLAGIYVSLHLALAIDRYVHTNYGKQVSLVVLISIVAVFLVIYSCFAITILVHGNGFEVVPAGFICTYKLTTGQDGDNLPRIVAGAHVVLGFVVFNVTLNLYVQIYLKLKKVGHGMAGDVKNTSGNDILKRLLYRCLGIMTGLTLCWGGVMLKMIYTVISNSPVNPVLDMIVILLTALDPVIIQVTLLVMNKPYWKAIQDTYVKFSIASQTKSKRMSTNTRVTTIAQTQQYATTHQAND